MNLNRPQMLSALAIIILSLTIHASAEWKEQVLYSFQGGNDGQTPAGGVVFDKQGNLYGATTIGTVFQLAPPAKKGDSWTQTVLYTLKGKTDNNDGMNPSGGLLIDSAGNLYGTTAYGGTGGCILLGILYGCGTVYELSPPQQKGRQWTETILYSFQSGNDGYYPWGNLTFDKAGNLYGATQFGGGKGTQCNPYYQYCGTVFKLSPPKQKGGAWTEQVLHSFAGGQDGANPLGGLLLDTKGTIYGTTYYGGGSQNCQSSTGTGCGTVFNLGPPKTKGGRWTEKVLHAFVFGNDGAEPNGGLIFDQSGALYGTTLNGGGLGTVFRLSSTGNGRWAEKVLYSFEGGNDGRNPEAGLSTDPRGRLYGTTNIGGSSFAGTMFQLTKDRGSWRFVLLYSYKGSPDAADPASNLALRKSGTAYGTSQYGGTGSACQGGCGTVFEASP